METDEERLDRLEREEAEIDAMDQLETKVVDARREMQIADALDDIRIRNAQNDRATDRLGKEVAATLEPRNKEELERQLEIEDEAVAKRAFAVAKSRKLLTEDCVKYGRNPRMSMSESEMVEGDEREVLGEWIGPKYQVSEVRYHLHLADKSHSREGRRERGTY